MCISQAVLESHADNCSTVRGCQMFVQQVSLEECHWEQLERQ